MAPFVYLLHVPGAMAGMIGTPLRHMVQNGKDRKVIDGKDVSKWVRCSGIGSVTVLLLTILMYDSHIV